MNRSVVLATVTCLLISISGANADSLSTSNGEGYIALAVEHAHSDNIRKASVGEESGYEQRADLSFGYNNQTATNNSALDYGVYYSHYSEPNIDDESNIAGSLSINQHLLSERLQLDLSHFRHSYLLDQTGVDAPENNGNRDVFTASPIWYLPYSNRAGFSTRYTYTGVRFSDDKQQNTDRHSLGLAWYHDLNSKTTYQVSSDYSEIEFLFTNLTYEQINVDMSLTGNLREGDYLLKAGYSRLSVLDYYEDGGIFQATYNYRFKRNTLSLNAQRELTDSSIGLGQDTPDSGDLAFNGTKLLWIDRVSLDHTLTAFNARLTNRNSAYYQQETRVLTREVEPRYGLSTQISWKHSQLISSTIKAEYSQTEIEPEIDKESWNASLSSEYRFHPKLAFAVTAQYEEQIENELVSGFDELRLIANISFRH